jgi:VanZ family protein
MKKSSFVWAVITIFMVLVALFFGLRPKGGALANDAQWLTDKAGIQFQGRGMAFVENLRAKWADHNPASFTIEMAATPASVDMRGFNPLIVMHDGADSRQLVIWQYRHSLIVMNGDDYDYKQRRPRVVARGIFSSIREHYVAVVSGRQGTRLYVDGVLADVKKDMRLAIPDSGSELKLVFGNSVQANHGWRGVLHKLAITATDFDGEAILQRYRQWASGEPFDSIRSDLSLLRFSFNANPSDHLKGRAVDSSIRVPEKLVALEKSFLGLQGLHARWSRPMVFDILVNVMGFVPLGIVFYGLIRSLAGPAIWPKRCLAVLACLLLSLSIELSQAWIPMRVSSLMDLLLNTFGAWIGVEIWRKGRAWR